MKIAIFSSAKILRPREELIYLMSELQNSGVSYCFNNEFADQIERQTAIQIVEQQRYDVVSGVCNDVDYVMSYGGDGTFLDSVKLLLVRDIPIFGVNSGRLGFLANVTKKGMGEAIESLKRGEFSISERILLRASGDGLGEVTFPYAYNEVAIQKGHVNMIDVAVHIDNELVATYRGDGVLIATPSGSTAYSMSVGGPIISPASRCLVISPIAPHNLTMRPLVIPDDAELKLTLKARDNENYISLDNRRFLVPNGSEFCVVKADKSVRFVNFPEISFYQTLRNKLMWGVDARDKSVK